MAKLENFYISGSQSTLDMNKKIQKPKILI